MKRVAFVLLCLCLAVLSACNGEPRQTGETTPISTPQQESEVGNKESYTNPVNTTDEAKGKKGEQTSDSLIACANELERLGQYTAEKGDADYRSGRRIFPLLHFILTKKSVDAKEAADYNFVLDNPIFVTKQEEYSNSLVFSTIHTIRTGILHGTAGFPMNSVTSFYEPMVLGEDYDYKEQVPGVQVTPDRFVELNRESWISEFGDSSKACEDVLKLPPASTEYPWFDYNHAVYPFSKEIDFVAGVEGVGNGLHEFNRYPEADSSKIQIPLLLYCPNCSEVEEVAMLQEQKRLSFNKDPYYEKWQDWLGKEWHMYLSEPIDFDDDAAVKADFDKLYADLPPFVNEKSSFIEVTLKGDKVMFFNQ
ncbi:hypothetical protein [Paenibacillus turpanensis]|uniref:hypothetical protein n=1 Tax=Paenibacillus turpanensis TaxID=2689078 RepID=UPI0014082C6A|nr:hypothetical protein [Paenibacillus turpanensis]